MTKIDEASKVRSEAAALLGILSVEVGRSRYAMGDLVSMALRVSRLGDEGDQYRIEILCHAYGALDAGWGDYSVVLTDNKGTEYPLELDSRGHASITGGLSRNTVLQGKKILSRAGEKVEPIFISWPKNQTVYGETSLAVAGAAAQTEVGELFTDSVKDFPSADGRVTARVRSFVGGNLGVVFTAKAEDADLNQALIDFRFFTNVGTELTDTRQLFPDDRQPDELTAFWSGNQTRLAPQRSGDRSGLSQKVSLAFEFTVSPKPEQRKE